MADTEVIEPVSHWVLVGGGHTHCLALQQWQTYAKQHSNKLRITLISDQTFSAYSGMLPGVIAGHFESKDAQIDCEQLCEQVIRGTGVSVEFIHGKVERIDARQQRIYYRQANHVHSNPSYNNDSPLQSIEYDVSSIDTGASSVLIPSHAPNNIQQIGIKPFEAFLTHWQRIIEQSKQTHQEPLRIGVLGAGAAGVEVVLAMAHALQTTRHQSVELHLISADLTPLSGSAHGTQRAIMNTLKRMNVRFTGHFRIESIHENQITGTDTLTNNTQAQILDIAISCLGMKAPSWISASELDTDYSNGYIAIQKTLQHARFDNVFACGDVAHCHDSPTPKAGVYAVRQAPVLLHNVFAYLAEQPLKAYQPQPRFLSLISLGDKRALLIYPPWYLLWPTRLLWYLKRRIDVRFIRYFRSTKP